MILFSFYDFFLNQNKVYSYFYTHLLLNGPSELEQGSSSQDVPCWSYAEISAAWQRLCALKQSSGRLRGTLNTTIIIILHRQHLLSMFWGLHGVCGHKWSAVLFSCQEQGQSLKILGYKKRFEWREAGESEVALLNLTRSLRHWMETGTRGQLCTTGHVKRNIERWRWVELCGW